MPAIHFPSVFAAMSNLFLTHCDNSNPDCFAAWSKIAFSSSLKNTNDSPIMPELLTKTSEVFTIKQVTGDKQYASEKNFQAIASHRATGFIKFREGTTGRSGGLFQKAFHFFSLHREEFLAGYHKRSNVESVFSAIKRKFGDAVRSKTEVAMKNEVLAKILSHNICCLISAMYELGIEPKLLAV